MTLVLRLSTCMLLAAALAACNKSEPAAPATTADTPAATQAADASQAPATTAAPTTPPADDTAPVALDMGKVKAWVQAQKNLGDVVKADPNIDPAQNLSEENLTQYTARLEADAKMRAAIEAAGLSTRDFARIGETLLGALMAEGAVEAGQLKSIPDGIDPASVEFVKQHKAELTAMMKGAAAG